MGGRGRIQNIEEKMNGVYHVFGCRGGFWRENERESWLKMRNYPIHTNFFIIFLFFINVIGA